jgi:cell division septation protein DedD
MSSHSRKKYRGQKRSLTAAPAPHVMSVHPAKVEPVPVIHTSAPVIVKVDAPKPVGFWNWVKKTFWQD